MPTLKQSWLADNYEQPQIIKELRHFIDERTTKPQTQQIDDIRSMRAVLEKLNLEESPKNSPDSASSTSDALYSPVRGGGLNQAWHNPQQTTWPRQPASHDYYGGNSLG